MINLEQFISKYVTERDSSLFARDIQNNSVALTKAIKDKSMLVIGGAGSIGKSNWGRIPEEEFLKKLSNGVFTLKTEVSTDLFERIKIAVKSSKTMTPKLLKILGL